MTEQVMERERQVRALRAAGEGAAAIARQLGISKASVYLVYHRDDDPAGNGPLLGLYTCDGCGREQRAPPGQETITCAHCDSLAWEPMSRAEMLRRLTRTVARLEAEAGA